MHLRGVSSLSLKERFAIVFSGLLVLAVVCCSLLLWEQHRIALRGAELAVGAQEQLMLTTRLHDTLGEIQRRAGEGARPDEPLERFRDLAERLRRPETEESYQILMRRFEDYAAGLPGTSSPEAVSPVQAGVDGISGSVQASTHHLAEKLRADQKRSVNTTLAFLSGFILLLLAAGYTIIAIITRPLSSLVRFLDEVNVEDDLPSSIPGMNSDVSEVQSVARSFEQLLNRLRSYRALNVRRLLIEKRRADIVAASITDGVLLLRNEEVLYVNPVGERILCGRGGFTGRSLNLALHSDKPGPRAVLTAISRSMPTEFVFEEDDRKTYYLIQAFPIADGVIEQAEHSMSGPMDELLERFQANTIVVAQDVTLVHESQEAKKHFLGTLSHEVKTPVTSLTMATRLLKRKLDQIENPQVKALISTCIDDVERLRGLLEDLLSVSRFESLTRRMEVQNIDVCKLIRHSVQSFQFQAKERGIDLSVKAGGQAKAVFVPIDATKVSWAVSNLMINAIRHTPPNGKIVAEIRVLDEYVEFRVRDTGPGIDYSRQHRIFDKFSPFYDLRVARTGGVGAGLAIAREIVVAHGGRIWVTSEPGRGAEFCFTLPLKRESGETMDEPVAEAADGVTEGLKRQMESMKGANGGTTASG